MSYIQSLTALDVNEYSILDMESEMTEEPGAARLAHEEGQGNLVSILVNDQPVRVEGPKVDGLQIKEAAIAAGVQIDLGFQLIEELPHDRTQVVGDTDVIEVRAGSRFLALAPDDNS